MVKSFGFTSFFTKTTKDNNEPWPSCKNRNTDCEQNLNFNKITEEHDATYDLSKDVVGLTESDRLFFEPGYGTKSIMEAAGVKVSDRLFFEPGYGTKSIMEAAGVKVAQKNICSTVTGSFKGGVAMAMESKDPYRDFRESMEQMVRVHGVKDWDWLQEMLGWYLRANGKRTHGIILGAFVDLLMSLAKSHNSSNLSNHISSCSSCSCFSFEIEEGIEKR